MSTEAGLEGLEPQEQACVPLRPCLAPVRLVLADVLPAVGPDRGGRGRRRARGPLACVSAGLTCRAVSRSLSVRPSPGVLQRGPLRELSRRGGALTWLGAARLGRGPRATSQEMQYMLLGLNQTTLACSEVVCSRPGLTEGTRVASGLVWGRHVWGGPGIESVGPGMLPTPTAPGMPHRRE